MIGKLNRQKTSSPQTLRRSIAARTLVFDELEMAAFGVVAILSTIVSFVIIRSRLAAVRILATVCSQIPNASVLAKL